MVCACGIIVAATRAVGEGVVGIVYELEFTSSFGAFWGIGWDTIGMCFECCAVVLLGIWIFWSYECVFTVYMHRESAAGLRLRVFRVQHLEMLGGVDLSWQGWTYSNRLECLKASLQDYDRADGSEKNLDKEKKDSSRG